MSEFVYRLQLGKTASLKSLVDYQVIHFYNEKKGKDEYMIKVEVNEWDIVNGKKNTKGKTNFFFKLGRMELIAEDILNLRFTQIWEKEFEKNNPSKLKGYFLYFNTAKNGKARTCKILFNVDKRNFEITVQEGEAKNPKADVSGIDYQKPFNQKYSVSTLQDMREAMISVRDYIQALSFDQAVRSKVQNLNSTNAFNRWNVIKLEKREN